MSSSDNSSTAVSGTQTIQRAVLLLRLLTANNRTGMRLVELHKQACLERSTTHRILQGLIAEQMVAQHPRNKRYYLGSSLYEMGLAAAPPFNLRDVCHPHIQHLARETGDTVFLTVRSGFDGVCVDRMEGSFPIRVFVLDIGRRRPLNIGAGNIAILSTLPDVDIERICLANHERVEQNYPGYSERALRGRIAQVRQKGYVVNEVLEVESARSIAIPLRTSFDGSATAAISISALADRLSPSRITEVANLLLATARAIEKETAALMA